MIDIHCHILPGIDDGPKDMQTALKMARIAVKDGIETVIATPHCYDGVYNCEQYDIQAHCDELNRALVDNNIPLYILPGAEIRLTPELLGELNSEKIMTLGDTGQAILLELPEFFLPDSVFSVLESLRYRNVRCILAHPERNGLILSNGELLRNFIRAGAEIQITVDSLLGVFGREVKLFSKELIRQGIPGVLASDGHGTQKRKPRLSKGIKSIGKIIGFDYAQKWIVEDLGLNKEDLQIVVNT